MKKILYCLFLLSICFTNEVVAQQKTPYEKKKEEISIKFLKKLGISQDKIVQAKEMGDIGLILLFGQAIQNMQVKDPMTAIAIMNEFDREIKETEKLKTEEDFRRERLKAQEKENRLKAEQAKLEQQRQFEQQQADLKRQEEEFNNSDYVTVKKEIKKEFDSWITKGEYEKTNEYETRLLNKELVLDSLAYRIVSLKMYSILKSREVILGQYNADLEIFPLEFKLNQNITFDSIYIDRNSASSFKNNYRFIANDGGTSDSIIIVYRELRNWIFLNNQLFPNRYRINGKKEFTNLPIDGTINQITFTTDELGLSSIFKNSYTFNAVDYEKKYEKRQFDIRKKKYESLIIEATNLEGQNNFNDAIEKLNQAVNLFPDSIEPKKRIDNLNFKLDEIKRSELIREAEQYASIGRISNSIDKYKEANKIRSTPNVTLAVSDLEINLNISKLNHKKLDSLFNAFLEAQSKVFLDLDISEQLDQIKDGYGDKFFDCSDTIVEKINKMWEPISKDYKRLKNIENIEVWTVEHRALEEKLYWFGQKILEFSLFEKRIYNAILSSDKKYLKVLKEEDENLIIDYVIKTEN